MLKKILTVIGISTFIFLLLISSVKSSIAEHTKKANIYAAQGMYEEAMIEYTQTQQKTKLVKQFIASFGNTNAFLSILGLILLIISSRKRDPRVKQIRITKDFNWKNWLKRKKENR